MSMSSAIKDYTDKCSIYHSFDSKQAKETQHSHQVPSRPWVKIGTDLFSWIITLDSGKLMHCQTLHLVLS